MKSERGAVKGDGSWEGIVALGPLEHRRGHLVGTKDPSGQRCMCK